MKYQTDLTKIKTVCLRNLRKKILEVYLGLDYSFKWDKNKLKFSGPKINSELMETFEKMDYDIVISSC